jgi:hypothetical protein
MSYFPRAARVVVVLALSGAVVVVPSTALATSHPQPASKPRHAQPPRVQLRAPVVTPRQLLLRKDRRVAKRVAIVFAKNGRNPFDSRVTFRAWARTGSKKTQKWELVEQASWRAGSGLGGRAGRDECHRNTGWLPNGTYSLVQHDHRRAPLVNGRVFELAPKACPTGTVRQMLFIHSEQTPENTQCNNLKGDDHCRWEPVWNDYRSNGCIKMSPTDLKNLTRRYHHYARADVRYPTSRVRLRVTG